ncbi:hypothetical protein [Variovorax sp. KK3]|uniref:hypothetical protein n=1 Tax=Variovorax sp. KK3 TaxID=1855728 RepID=UPI00097C205E|nr:hypothetical protein [Variovorax sp. KK3]
MNKPADKPAETKPDIQGEGNYDATRRYDKATTDFVQSGKVDQAAKDAKPRSEAEAEEMRRAEEEGKSHAKGEDPALRKGAGQ